MKPTFDDIWNSRAHIENCHDCGGNCILLSMDNEEGREFEERVMEERNLNVGQ